MTPDQIVELIDLYLDDELPVVLRSHVETYLAAHAGAAEEARSLRAAAARLRTAATERPDAWFVERTLDSLLHENAAQAPAAASR